MHHEITRQAQFCSILRDAAFIPSHGALGLFPLQVISDFPGGSRLLNVAENYAFLQL
jgi:hypothetical protein